MDMFRHIPCGTRMPSSLHAVSVSIPTFQDVIGYEENDPATRRFIRTGYPRFVTHPYVLQVRATAARELGAKEADIAVFASEHAAARFQDFLGRRVAVHRFEDAAVAVLPGDEVARETAKFFLQHTGAGIFSRQAEDFLLKRGLIDGIESEEIYTGDAHALIGRELARLYGAPNPDHVFLSSCGMSAIFGVYSAFEVIMRRMKRTDWVEFGWLYLDTMRILEKFPAGSRVHLLPDASAPGAIEKIEALGSNTACVLVEIPTNPLVQTPDLKRLHELSRRFGFAVIADVTLATPVNVDVLPFADVVVESLTKYACGSGDVMMGSAVVNPASPFADELKGLLPAMMEIPGKRDAARLAHLLPGYAGRIKIVNRNMMELAPWLEAHPAVKDVYWAYRGASAGNYRAIERRPDSPGGLMSIVLAKGLPDFYDRLEMAKGPSLGTEFTLACPYMYLAHYDLVSTDEGRHRLRDLGVEPDLLRISVGVEPAERIKAALDRAFA